MQNISLFSSAFRGLNFLDSKSIKGNSSGSVQGRTSTDDVYRDHSRDSAPLPTLLDSNRQNSADVGKRLSSRKTTTVPGLWDLNDVANSVTKDDDDHDVSAEPLASWDSTTDLPQVATIASASRLNRSSMSINGGANDTHQSGIPGKGAGHGTHRSKSHASHVGAAPNSFQWRNMRKGKKAR